MSSQSFSSEGSRKVKGRSRAGTTEAEVGVQLSEVGGKGHEPRSAGGC